MTNIFSIAKVVVGLPIEGPFDYAIPVDLQGQIMKGQRVRILFNRRKMVGYVVDLKQKSRFKSLNPVIGLLDTQPALSTSFMLLTKEFSQHYGCSWGEAIETCLPPPLRKGTKTDGPELKPGQALPVKAKNILVHDETRTQRWPFLIEKIQSVINKQQSVIFLVPETHLIRTVRKKLDGTVQTPVIVFDKAGSVKKELDRWLQVKKESSCLVVGTRSAVFAPVNHLGLIVIYDEEREAYKQEQVPCYRAGEVAQLRQKIEKAGLLLVSAAPRLETWSKAKKEHWEMVEFKDERPRRAKAIDMTNYRSQRMAYLSYPLQNEIQKALERKGRIILFLNKKGFTTFTRCDQCGFVIQCDRCNIPLTYLYDQSVMTCTRCNQKSPRLSKCPSCDKAYLKSTGTGIEKLESEAARLYPAAVIRHYQMETDVLDPQADIIIATQAILKQREDLQVDLVAVINLDAELNRCDFRSEHKVFSLLSHLNKMAQGSFVVQTRQADGDCLKAFIKGDSAVFYAKALRTRKELELPPFREMCCLSLRGREEKHVMEASQHLFDILDQEKTDDMEVLDPQPDIIPKLRDQYRYIIMLKSKSVKKLIALAQTGMKKLKRNRHVIITLDVNP